MEWRLGWIPLGGYVRFSGDESIASVPDAGGLAELRAEVLAREGPAALNRYFHFKPLWQRALVVAAGPVANFILGIVIFSSLALALGEIVLKPRVGDVAANSPAAQAGFQAQDLILRADGRPIANFTDLTQFIVLRTGEPIQFEVERQGRLVQLVATPIRRTEVQGVKGCPMGLGCLGLSPSRSQADLVLVRYGPIGALNRGVRETSDILGTTFRYLGRMATGRESGNQFGGIIGMAGRTGQVASDAVKDTPNVGVAIAHLAITLIEMAGFVSVAVGFANLLPIPVLDGGHLLFYGYEAVARRPLSANVQAAGYRVGFALLIGLMLFVTWNDLQRYQVIHFIGGLFS